MTGVEFIDGEPPADKRRTAGWIEKLAPLRERPGQWAKLPGRYRQGTASEIQRGLKGGIRRGEYEAVMRDSRVSDTGKRCGAVWARYIGEAQ